MYISTNPGLGARWYPARPDRTHVANRAAWGRWYPTIPDRRHIGMGALNCPGDPGCPGNVEVPLACCANAAAALMGGCDDSCIAGATPEQAAALMQQQIYALQNRLNAPVPVAKEWIPGLSNVAVGIGAAAFGGLLLMKALR